MFKVSKSITTLCLFVMPFLAYSQQGKNESKDQSTQSIDLNSALKPVKWRSIGPFRGGRSVATSGVVGNPYTYYMGITGGGLWKTDDMGITWNNISDGFFKTGSVGAVAVSESDPNTVYVGMGEHAVRGVMTHHGDGVYKSQDAGKTWKKMGLDLTQHIARIVIHPKNPDILYVAAQGALYSTSTDRGIYKSIDGGITWTKSLYVDDKTGCAEISMDMTNPTILYAAMWEHGRQPWKITSGGPGSGLYKSVDSGASWTKIHEGLPKEMGKMAVSVCRSNPEKVYALIESDSKKEAGGLFVSENAGKSWSLVTNDHRLVQRAWYYIEVFTDPLNENVVYVLSAPALKSIDGGKNWEVMNSQHGDHHDLWINPHNSNNFVLADDGGACVTFNGGKSYSSQENMPTGQYYRINVDNQNPYRIYAGQQDNSSVVIASAEPGSGGISKESWTYSAGGESAFLAFDPDNPHYVMGGSYLGTIEILDTKAKAGTKIMAAPIQYLAMDPKDMKYRFNWNAPIIHSHHDKGTFYHGAQLLLRTSDMGKTWTEVSPDLTRNDKSKQGPGGGPYTNEVVGAENYGTLAYVVESQLEKGVIWTGSDDGYVHVTRDNGKNWINVTPKELKECLINAIEVSPYENGTVYIATTRFKFNDHAPGLYRTRDYGKTWQNINGNLPKNAFTRVVREDNEVKGLLYAGTELGIFVSYDNGLNWYSMQLNLPIAPITDLRVHRGNLIAATSGRAFWILDDLAIIRQYKSDKKDLMVYKPSATILTNGYSELNSANDEFKGSNPMHGVNPSTGSVIYYNLPEKSDSLVLTMKILDANGNLVRQFSSKADSTYLKYDGGPSAEPLLSKKKGLNKFVWNLRHQTMPGIPHVYIESSFAGHKAIPGNYQVILSLGDLSSKTTVEIKSNPNYNVTTATYKAYDELMGGMEKNVSDMHNMVNSLYAKRSKLELLLASLPKDEKYKSIREQGNSIIKVAKEWDEDMIQRLSKAYDDVENFPNKFTAEYMFMMNECESDIPQINQSSLDLLKIKNEKWEILKGKGIEISDRLIPLFNEQLWKQGIGGIW
jgi:photosystem II stability/assembly factor-like uncharacterized protein